MKFTRFLAVFIMLFAAAGAGAADHKDHAASADSARSLTDILDSGVLKVAVALYPPWAMRSDEGELRGFEIDVANRLARDMGVEVEFVVPVWDELVPTLMSGKADIIASGFSITPDRALKMNFSAPYSNSGTGLATNLSLTSDFDSLSDLNSKDVTIAVVTGTLSERLARSTFEAATFAEFDTSDLASDALVEGKAHAFVVANPVPRFISLRHPDKVDVPLPEPLRQSREAFAIRKGDPDFLAYLNAWINAHEADMWLQGHHDYWFNSLNWRASAGK
ncbi:MAG: transporter substrate-binding domain-containing protein [Pseudomonadota bacterium]